MKFLKEINDSLLHLAFPHICEGCGSDRLELENFLCLNCLNALPETNFHLYASNPAEAVFLGRIEIANGTAQYYFTGHSLMQRLLYRFKYYGHKELGLYLGCLMGKALAQSGRFDLVEALVPLPLHERKERKRSFNQSLILCEGIASVWSKPVIGNAVKRIENTSSQTRKNRIERWQNMEGKFTVSDVGQLENKHILLVDDVITTGATLEACGKMILEVENVRLSIAALCFAT